MVGSRSDIFYALNYYCKFQDQATDEGFTHLKRILRYLKDDKMLTYQKLDCENLFGYVDTDWANDSGDRKSVTGYCFYVLGNLVSCYEIF